MRFPLFEALELLKLRLEAEVGGEKRQRLGVGVV